MSYPRCSVISSLRADSSTVAVRVFGSPLRAGQVLAAGAFESKSYGPAARIADVIAKFADDRMLEPLRAFREDRRRSGR